MKKKHIMGMEIEVRTGRGRPKIKWKTS